MKTRKSILLNLSTALLACSLLVSCQKEKPITINESNNSEIAFADDTYKEVMDAVNGGTQNHKSLGCKIVTRDTVNNKIVIDFGSSCSDGRGNTRSGQIVIRYNNPNFISLNNTIKVSFVNYIQNGMSISGGSEYNIVGYNSQNNLTIESNSVITLTSSSNLTTTITSTQNYELISGLNSSTKEDDVYTITGTSVGDISNGNHFRYDIIEPLYKSRASNCNEFYTQGITYTRRSNADDKIIDYGDGTCDNLATETINGTSRVITLN